jgi:hypothetical protein
MGIATTSGVDFVVTIAVEPTLSTQGLLNLKVTTVKVGALNITPLARLIAKKMYTERVSTVYVDTAATSAKIAASLLNDKPFVPIFPFEDSYVHLKKITIEQQKLTAHLKQIHR